MEGSNFPKERSWERYNVGVSIGGALPDERLNTKFIIRLPTSKVKPKPSLLLLFWENIFPIISIGINFFI